MRFVHKGPTGPDGAARDNRGWVGVRYDLRAALEGVSGKEKRTKAARRFFDKELDKAVLYEALLQEQARVCVFCERRIRAVDGRGKSIRNDPAAGVNAAHWEPLSTAPERTVDWDNLYASCRHPRTCDRRQGKEALGFGPPAAVHLERLLHFRIDGVIEVRDHVEEPTRAALERALRDDDASTLRLNDNPTVGHDGLVGARARARVALRKRYRPWPDAARRREIAERLLRQNPRPDFVSVLVQELVGEPIDAPPHPAA